MPHTQEEKLIIALNFLISPAQSVQSKDSTTKGIKKAKKKHMVQTEQSC